MGDVWFTQLDDGQVLVEWSDGSHYGLGVADDDACARDAAHRFDDLDDYLREWSKLYAATG